MPPNVNQIKKPSKFLSCTSVNEVEHVLGVRPHNIQVTTETLLSRTQKQLLQLYWLEHQTIQITLNVNQHIRVSKEYLQFARRSVNLQQKLNSLCHFFRVVNASARN